MKKEKQMITEEITLIESLTCGCSLTNILSEASSTFKSKFPDTTWDLTNEEFTDKIQFDIHAYYDRDQDENDVYGTLSYSHTRLETYQERDARIEREARWEKEAQERKDREEIYKQKAIEAEKKLLAELTLKYKS